MKNLILSTVFLLSTINIATAQEEIKLYPNGPKESNGLQTPEKWDNEDFVTHTSEARMYTYIVPKEKASGAAVLICPGGGYWGLSTIKEGTEFAKWLNDLGISAFVLYYRMPNEHHDIPLTDAQTAMEIIRGNAKKWNIDKQKIGVAGFSAGGHLASTLGTHFTKKSRPDFLILVYPVITMTEATHGGSRNNLLSEKPSEEMIQLYSNELQVTKNTPPAFLVHAKNDKTVPIKNSEMFYDALQKENIPAEFHIYEEGGHGFGLRNNNVDSSNWPNELREWLESMNLTSANK